MTKKQDTAKKQLHNAGVDPTKRLKAIRSARKAGLSPEEIADHMGVSPQAVRDVSEA